MPSASDDNGNCLAQGVIPGVVVGLDCVTGLQSSRILASHGVSVIGIAQDAKHFCCQTNTCQRVLVADTTSEDLITTLERLGPTLELKGVLFPCTDASVLLVSTHRQRLDRWFHIVLPPRDVVETCLDKVKFYTHAQSESLSIPKTYHLRSRADAELAAEKLKFPAVLKPAMKTPMWKRHTRAKVLVAADASQLLTLYDRCQSWGQLLTVQEWVPGSDANLITCYCCFDTDSQLVTSFVARKLRQWPPGVGTSSLGEQCRDEFVRKETIRVFSQLGICGLAYLEFKRHAQTGEYFIIEPNIGRPGVRSAIAEANGVDLVYTMYCNAIGLPHPISREQECDGVKWVYWRQDIKSAVDSWWRGELSISDWKQSWRGRKVCAVYSKSDPRPFWADVCRLGGCFSARQRTTPRD